MLAVAKALVQENVWTEEEIRKIEEPFEQVEVLVKADIINDVELFEGKGFNAYLLFYLTEYL